MAADVDALLARLVAQFESPYDFLRELVQNAMDAGSDRVEVTLESHPLPGSSGGADDEVVFELTVMDAGAGMDEAIIDRELTKLFASSKGGDRTMAGGFGIGFVSVFAWEPEAVLVHTGRGGESWELLFHADRTFEKVALEQPVEGTTIISFRRGRASEREGIAEAVRDSLWRWCRFVPLEISFEDRDSGDPPELIQDAPEDDGGLGAGLTRADVRGDTTLRVSFAVPPHAIMLRRGLILAEGGPRQLLGGIATQLGETCEHLQIWADSPLLRTTLARDKVVDDEGRKQIEQRLLGLVEQLRGDLLAKLEELAAVMPAAGVEQDERLDPSWTPERHALYSVLHAHLAIEHPVLGKQPRQRAILRDLVHGKAIALDAVAERMKGQPLLLARPFAWGAGEGPQLAGLRELLMALRPTSLPVIAGHLDDDGPWLRPLAELVGARWLPVEQVIARVEPRPNQAVGLCGMIQGLLTKLDFDGIEVALASFSDLAGRADPNPLFGLEIVGAARPIAVHGGDRVIRAQMKRRKLWLNSVHVLVIAAIESFVQRPLLAGLSLLAGVLGHLDEPPDPGDLMRPADELAASAGAIEA